MVCGTLGQAAYARCTRDACKRSRLNALLLLLQCCNAGAKRLDTTSCNNTS
jgi:hypothetical protein